MIKLFLSRQFLLFLGVGATAAIINWLTRIALSQWLPFKVAVASAYTVGMATAFVLNALFVFPGSTKPRSLQIRDFVLVNVAFFPVVWAAAILIDICLDSLGWYRYREGVAHGFALGIPAIATFLIYKFFAFKDTSNGRR